MAGIELREVLPGTHPIWDREGKKVIGVGLEERPSLPNLERLAEKLLGRPERLSLELTYSDNVAKPVKIDPDQFDELRELFKGGTNPQVIVSALAMQMRNAIHTKMEFISS